MKVLLIGSFEYTIYAPAFESGFKALGHEVISIDYRNYLYGGDKIGSFLTRVQNRYHVGYKMKKYNRDIEEIACETNPDFIFLYRCYHIWPSTIRRLKKKGFFIFTYNNDDPFSGCPSKKYYRFFQAIIPLVDVNYVYRKKNFADYQSVKSKDTQLLLPYYLEHDNYFENCDDDIPVAFIGHYENDGRDRYIKRMLDAEIPVSVFSSGWHESPMYEEIKSCILPRKMGTEYNRYLNRCKIALVFLSRRNNDTYTRRCFEIPATRTLMLSEYTDDLNSLFPDGECAVYFHNEEEAVNKCKWLLSHPEEIRRIAQNGYKRVRELGATEVDRCRQIVSYFQFKER